MICLLLINRKPVSNNFAHDRIYWKNNELPNRFKRFPFTQHCKSFGYYAADYKGIHYVNGLH